MYKCVQVPQKLNPDALKEFEVRLDAALYNEELSVIVLTGDRHYFCLGMDLEYVTNAWQPNFVLQFCALLQKLRQSNKPLLAMVEGDAIAGGIALMLSADFILAGDAAHFSLPESRFDITPGIAMACLLERLRPHQVKQLIWTPRSLSAQEALALGLIDKISRPDHIEYDLHTLSHQFSQVSSCVVRDSKRLLNQHISFNKTLTIASQLLREKFAEVDTIEKVRNYLDVVRGLNDDGTNEDNTR